LWSALAPFLPASSAPTPTGPAGTVSYSCRGFMWYLAFGCSSFVSDSGRRGASAASSRAPSAAATS
jgi:hypothetical protein